MPKDNAVWVRGRLAADPHFEVLDGRTPYCRFNLVVVRDHSQSSRQTPAGPDSGKSRLERSDLLRVSMYGERASVEYFYLRKGAEVAVSGWMESRRYFDKQARRWRMVQEINAQSIVFGPGCDFTRGDAQRARKMEEALERGVTNLESLGLAPLEALPEGLELELE